MALYGIFSFLDGAIYSMVSFVVKLIIIIANYNFFKTEVIEEVVEKVYIALGVLVLFKIVISCIQYMINPDTFDDKDKGMAGLLKKAAISMGLIVLIQPIFNFALSMQTVIVSTIPGLVMGDGNENYQLTNKDNAESVRTNLDGIGDMVAGSTVWTFVTYKGEFKNKTVENIHYEAGVGAVKTEGGKTEVISGTVSGFRENITKGCDGSIWALFDTKRCIFDYRVGISTAAGLFLLYVLASLCLDVGIRAIKLGILQMLAPIPIGSYIVSKDKLNKFVKLATQVYIDLFIRLGVIYFIIFFVRKVISALESDIVIANGNYVPDDLEKAFVKVIIIVALFMFAKKAPQFICDVLGIENKGLGDMADMFRPVWSRAGGAVGALANIPGNAIANYVQARRNGEGHVARILRALGGAGRGAVDMFAGAANGDNWEQMRKRHETAASRSNRRSVQHVNRSRAIDDSGNIIKRTKQRLEELRNRHKNYVTDEDRENARQEYATRLQGLHDLENRIATTTDPAEKRRLTEQYMKESAALAMGEEQYVVQNAARFAAVRNRNVEIGTINAEIAGYQNEMAEINAMLAAGGLSAHDVAELEAGKLELEGKIADAQGRLNNLTHENEQNEAQNELTAANTDVSNIDTQLQTANNNRQDAQTRVDNTLESIRNDNDRLEQVNAELRSLGAGDPRQATLLEEKRRLEARISTSATELANARAEVASCDTTITTLTANREKATARVDAATKKIRDIQVQINAETEARVAAYNAEVIEIENLENELSNAEGALEATKKAIRGTKVSNVTSYFGADSASGKGYLDLSNFLGSSRGSIFTGEAMTKMSQNANVVIDSRTGKPVEYKTKYCTNGNTYSYSSIKSLLDDFKAGHVSQEQLRTIYGFADSSILESAFKDIEKKAAADYINANLVALHEEIFWAKDSSGNYMLDADGHHILTVNVELAKGTATNSAVDEWWSTFSNELYKNGARKKDLDALYAEFSRNPGDFIKNASGYKDRYATIGKRIVDSTKPDDGKK